MKTPRSIIKARISFILLAVLTVLPGSAKGELCTIDDVPAATLLVPYFEVSLPQRCARGRFDTEIKVTNLGAAARIANVVIWSEWSVPVLRFQLELTGYDVDSFKLSDVLCQGIAPDISSGPQVIDADDLSYAQAVLTGRPAPATGQCASHPNPSGKGVGYITIDVVNTDSPGMPGDGASYVNDLGFANVLLGDIYYLDAKVPGATRVCGKGGSSCIRQFKRYVSRERGVPGIRAVAIEAGEPGDFSAGDRTFYGRYLGANATDRREPLPTTYHVRYAQTERRKKFDLIVWREGNSASAPVSCLEEPSWHPMGITQAVAFDENSNPIDLEVEFGEEATLSYTSFHDETTVIKNALRDLEFEDGWIFLNFSTLFTADNPYSDSSVGAYVLVRRDGRISTTGVHAVSPSTCSS